ncbi:hypothetical protein [Arenimonas sp.]|uniref:hypothetical protein n=1 Tax=Arenimonas sp. TaxID=1872635 RepID=UPI0039E68F9C
MKAIPILLLSVLLLSACAGDEGPPAMTAQEQDEAQALLTAYETARSGRNWESAETAADNLRRRFPESDAAKRLANSLEDTRAQAEAVRETRRLQSLWDYQAVSTDGGVQRSAAIDSRTVLAEEGQPAPRPDARLVLRDHPAWGRSAYLLLAQSRFQCGTPCTVNIRFDSGDPLPFAGKQADSGQGPALFVEDEQGFVSRLAQSQKVRIELPKGSGLVGSVSFDVGGYDAARYAQGK